MLDTDMSLKEHPVQNISIWNVLTPSRIVQSKRTTLFATAAMGAACWLLGGGLGADYQLTETAVAQERPGGDGGRGRGDRGDRGGRGERGERGERGDRGDRGGRGGRQGWGGGGGGGAPGMRDIQEQLQPDFMRRDMSLFVEQLALDDAQELVLETLFEDYELAYEERAGAVQEQLRDLGRQMFSTMMSPQMREQMGDRMRGIRDELDEIEAEQGELSRDERRELFMERMQSIQEEMQADRAEQGLDLETKAAVAEIFELFEAWMVEKALMRERFITGVKSQLSKDQLEAWPSFERFLVREKSLPKSRLSGEGANLFLAIDQYGLDDASFDRLEPLFDAYEVALHETLVSRDRFLETSSPKLYKALQTGNQDEARRIVNRQVDYRKAIRNINDQYIVTFVSEVQAIDAEEAARFARALQEGAYERVYRETRTQRAYTAAFEMDLAPEVRSAVTDLFTSYMTELDAMNARLVSVIRKEEPAEQLQQVNQMSAFLDGNFMGAWNSSRWGGGSTDDPVRAAYEKRSDLDETYYERLIAVLTPEQAEALPGSGRGNRGERGGRGGEGGGRWGGNFNMDEMPEQVRERLIERFDTDGDGELSESEIEEMRERFRGGGGGRGGQGGQGGRGGRGGGGGPPV